MVQGRPQKKRAVSKFRNEKHAIFTTNHQCIALTMCLHTRILVELFFRIPVLLILVGASPFALSLTVKSIISSSVSQAIRSIFSGHVLRPTLVLYFRCRHRPRVFRKFWATNALLLDVIKCFDTRKSYNRHRVHRSYAGTACADIGNGRQLISRGAASGDRPKLFSMHISLAQQQNGANPGWRLRKCYAALRSRVMLRKCVGNQTLRKN